MAIAFDAVSTGSTTGTSLTSAHTCTGTNLILLVGVTSNNGASNFVTGVTYAGVAMTSIGERRKGDNERWLSFWYLIAPATGANNIVVSASSSTFLLADGASYTGVKQTGQPDASATNADVNVSTFNTSLTSIADNCWHIMYVGNALGAHAAGTGTTIRGTAAASNICDSNSAKTPAGSVTLQLTYGGVNDWGSVIASIAPAVSSASVSDTVTISENVSQTQVFTASVSDAISITENISQTQVLTASVSDAVTISESTTLEKIMELPLVVDTVSITEDVAEVSGFSASVFDAISITEDATVFILTYGVNVSDAVTISENIVTDVTVFLSVFDAILISESTSPNEVFLFSVSDSISVVEGGIVVEDHWDGDFFDALSITENVSLSLNQNLSTFDSMNISEDVFLSLSGFISTSDSVSVSESASSVLIFVPALVTESISISEDVGTVLTQELPSVSDSVSISESVSLENARYSPFSPLYKPRGDRADTSMLYGGSI